MATTLTLVDDEQCFVCGKSNVDGLQLNWKTDGLHAETEYYPAKSHQGWAGLVHGGLLGAVLDEAITRLAWKNFGGVVTAEISIRYFNPARIGEKLFVRADILPIKNKLVNGKAEIRNSKGRIVATAIGKVLKVKEPSS